MTFFDQVLSGNISALLKLGSAWFLFFGAKYHFELRSIASWPSALGNLTHFNYHQGDGSSLPILTIKYDFIVNGVEYTGKRLAHIRFGTGRNNGSKIRKMMNKVQRVGGTQVVIYHHPKKPQKNLLLKPSGLEYFLLIACYAGAFGLAYLSFTN